MKLLLAICLTVSLAPAVALAQANSSLTRVQIKEAELRLSNLGYWTGPVDGMLDPGTKSALIAFQKWQGREITGQLTSDELEAIRRGSGPRAKEPGYEHVEIDLDRQVLMLVNEDSGVRVLPVSTGNNKSFVDEGQESIAYTPRGRFLVHLKEVGWQTGSLGSTYYANFISGGVAIHGSRNVPNEPASHGCIRIPMFAARQVSKLLKVGTIVLVYDKRSFVSAKDWVLNPRLKESALSHAGATDYPAETENPKTKSVSSGNKRFRTRLVRA